MTEDWRDEDGCCPCCCTCYDNEHNYGDDSDVEDQDIDVTPPEPYQMWLIAEWAPKDFNEILKRYYVGPISEYLNQPSLLWALIADRSSEEQLLLLFDE
jgi:hypothetical protein